MISTTWMTSEMMKAKLMRSSLMAACSLCMQTARIMLITALLLGCAAAGAQRVGQTPAAPRPRIGLVLSGGGARGAAHIGVLKMLDRLHVPIDAIAGTSMGAVVGALYASGMSGREIEQAMASVDWQAAFCDRLRRHQVGYRRQEGGYDILV